METVNTFVAAAGLVVASFLFIETRHQVTESIRANDIAFDAVRNQRIQDSISSLATEKSLQLTEQSLQISHNSVEVSVAAIDRQTDLFIQENRAYVVVESIVVKTRPNRAMYAMIKLKNTGNTPANYLYEKFDLTARSVDTTAIAYREPENIMDTTSLGVNLAPSETHEFLLNTGRVFTAHEDSVLRNSGNVVTVTGTYVYTDIHNNDRMCTFVYRVRANTEQFEPLYRMNYCE